MTRDRYMRRDLFLSGLTSNCKYHFYKIKSINTAIKLKGVKTNLNESFPINELLFFSLILLIFDSLNSI